MKEIFADTFFFIALLSPSERVHALSTAYAREQKSILVTTAWVVTELANTFSRQPGRSRFLEFYRDLRTDPYAIVIGPEGSLFDAGLVLYEARQDKEWSLTDCISFVVMEERGITDALTGDRHFEQAGFRALLRMAS